MKKILASIVAVIAIGISVSAQEKSDLKQYKKDVYKNHQRGERHHRRDMMKDLNLTEDQKTQLKANHEALRSKMLALDKEDNITVKEMRQRKAALIKEQKAKNDAVFTSDQKEKMALAKLKHEQEAKQHAEARLSNMKTKLSLTDDQVTKLKAQDENTRSQMKAIRENESLDPASKKEQMMALRSNVKEQRKSILTADQLKKMEDARKDKSKDFKKSKK